METLHVMVREAVEQIPPRRLLRDEDRDAIRRHQEWLLAPGPGGRSRSGGSLVSVLPRRGAPNLWWVRGAPASGIRGRQRE